MSEALEDVRASRSLPEKGAVFRGARGDGSACSGPAIAPLSSSLPLPNRTALLKANRKSKEGEETLASHIPNPFPELIPPDSSVISECLLPWTKSSATQVIKVYNEDNTNRAIEVPCDITARDICQLFILKNHCVDDHNWTLFEQLSQLGIERTIEDHESVMEVQASWDVDADNRLYFRKNYAKYEFFKKPLDFFPDHMVSTSNETNGIMNHSQLIQTFLSSSTCPEIHGYLHAKEFGRKCWKKFYFVLRRSGLYYSNKGMSKEPRHLQFIAEFSDSDVYTLLSARKTQGAPTDYGFCIKPNKSSSPRDLKLLCADEEHIRTCWVTAIRLFKYGMQLYQNFIQPHQKQRASPMRSISENSLVAMDFSGHKSRVIENPSEALSVAVEEGLTWRRKSCHRLSCHGSPSASQSPLSNLAIHRAQPWFHSKLSRDEAHRLIAEQGLIDGVFLLRDSQSNPKTFVLSLCHAQRIKHFQILPVEDEGELFFSLDDGHTRFSDLIQLVEFHQLNRGILPCRLKHPCTRIAL
ncbi:hypothetical protein ANANG_G00063400 [Anguilla anguilla]|uniref:Growth factor receptor bound protein 14 n=1 Tax=Anguilla anguilla TaxID=7936 RepID=A0A9D3MPP7_ANGAN|nr:hypothetical protein ANANG_G00063400 [Anguilla anguilla]